MDEEFVRADEILAGTLKTFRDEGIRPDVYAAALLQVGVFSMLMWHSAQNFTVAAPFPLVVPTTAPLGMIMV